MNSVSKLNLKQCYGCTACESICPQHAIKMKSNHEGFLYPFIDNTKCIDCGLCLKVCNTQEQVQERTKNNKIRLVYAAWNKDRKIVLNSTSGGVFYTLAYKFIQNGGITYGVAWDKNIKATHIRIDNIKDLHSIIGSKYVQSDLGTSYESVKKDLKKGLNVLFSGTPCQIAGLKSYLQKDYPNLYLIDFVCHGVPSPKMFENYIQYIEKEHNKKVIDYAFRSKKESGWRAYEKIKFQSHTLVRTSGHQPYSFGFYSNYFSRECCYNCAFSEPRRTGDITLSDFWGAESYHKELKKQRKYGFNFVGINNDKGEKLFHSIIDSMNTVESTLSVAIEGDSRLTRSCIRPDIRDSIYILLKEKGFKYIANEKLRPHYWMIKCLIPDWLKNIKEDFACKL